MKKILFILFCMSFYMIECTNAVDSNIGDGRPFHVDPSFFRIETCNQLMLKGPVLVVSDKYKQIRFNSDGNEILYREIGRASCRERV
jgi:hypothetical protein